MGDSGMPVDDQIDWELLFDNTPEDLNFFDIEVDPSLPPNLSLDGSLINDFSNLSPGSSTLSVDELEQLLMRDDDDRDRANSDFPNEELSNGFFSDILLDSPVDCDGSGEVVDVSDGKNSIPLEEEEEGNDVADHKENSANTDTDPDPHDPDSKKRKRQLRNRDAAVRSRERKKMYVRDLEMKSRHYEGECKRLGMLLQCFLAENQALRLSLQNGKAFDASMTKQESAVLLLESLLLGSLLWFLGIVCLFTLPGPVQLQIVENGKRLNLAPRKVGSNICGPLPFQSSLVGRRCKASRSRMKPSFLSPEVLG